LPVCRATGSDCCEPYVASPKNESAARRSFASHVEKANTVEEARGFFDRSRKLRIQTLHGRLASSGSSGLDGLVAASTTTAAAAATTSVATAAATATATITTTAATATTFFTRTGFVDSQTTAVLLLIIERSDGRTGSVVVAHFDKAKALATAGVAILNHLRATDFAILRKQVFQGAVRHRVRQIAHIQFHSHSFYSTKHKARGQSQIRTATEGTKVVVHQEGKAREKPRATKNSTPRRIKSTNQPKAV
jgi:hypothetical protein